MKRIVPTPLLSAGLFAFWLMLARSIDASQILLGICVAVATPLLIQGLRPRSKPVRNPRAIGNLLLRVGGDVIRSGLEVGHTIVNMHKREPCGTFVRIPLELRNDHGLAALSMITAVIPGTVWCELAADRSALLLHVFDLKDGDEASFIHRYKARYEHALTEIFQ